MSRALPWYKRNPDKWRNGTRGMSMELRGFYSEFLDASWERQGQLPKDVKWLSHAFQCSTQLVRALMPKLISAGKVIETATGYYNPRMAADIAGVDEVAPEGEYAPIDESERCPLERETRAKRQPNASETQTEIQKKLMISSRDLEIDSEIDNNNIRTSARSSDPFGFRNSSIEAATFDGQSVRLTAAEHADWVAKFGSAQRLDAALHAIVAFIQPNSSKTMTAQVRSQLGQQLGWKLERDERAASRPAANVMRPQFKSFAQQDAERQRNAWAKRVV